MEVSPGLQRAVGRLALAIGVPILMFGLLELSGLGWRLVRPVLDRNEPALHVKDASFPELYRLNPEHPEVSAAGLRDCSCADEAGAAKTDQQKILFIGDSVTWGYGVSCEEAFPCRLEAQAPDGTLRCLNAGVTGYTTYNEVESYKAGYRALDPDIVVLVTVLNDFANPRLHWAESGRNDLPIPQRAIPDPVYDRDQAQPVFNTWRQEYRRKRWLTYRLLRRVWPATSVPRDQTPWPVQLTGEDDYPITRLLDREAPALTWYGGLVRDLRNAVRADEATLLVVVVPLAYQLAYDYPYLPQDRIVAVCADLGVDCLDVLPEFRASQERGLFLDSDSSAGDIWHLSAAGHDLLAAILAKKLIVP